MFLLENLKWHMWLTLYFYWTTSLDCFWFQLHTAHCWQHLDGTNHLPFLDLSVLLCKMETVKLIWCTLLVWRLNGHERVPSSFLRIMSCTLRKTTLEIEPSLEFHVRFNLSYVKSGVGGVRHLIVYGFFKRSHFFSVCNSNSSLI